LHQEGRLSEAEQSYRQVLAASADHAEARYLLAAVLDAQGRSAEAAELLSELVARFPHFAEARNQLGAILARQGNFDDAAAQFEAAALDKPDWTEPRQNRDSALIALYHQRSAALVSQGNLGAAADCLRAALALRPNDTASLGQLGNLLKQQGALDEAAACYRRVLALDPKSTVAHYSLGALCADRLDWDEAAAHFRRALELQPDNAPAHCGLGQACVEQVRLPQAVAHYRRAVALAPQWAEAHFQLACALLLCGQFCEGWKEYEWRLRRSGVAASTPAEPLWTGSAAAGQTILLCCEQGFGDALQFVRFAADLKRQGATVVVECWQPLASLVASCPGVDRVVVRGETRPPFDAALPLLSLPGILGISLDTIPAPRSYLQPDPVAMERWRVRLADDGMLKVGLVWQGDPRHPRDRQRSLRLEMFAGLAAVDGVRFYSLQVGEAGDQLTALAGRFPIVDLADELSDLHETAAAMRQLDLVISCDSAPAHLAGALGVPVWVALPFAPDWRWLLGRDDSPWYPSMRLFRQPRPGDWADVLRRMARELAASRRATNHAAND
jgi:tetratricopeptide (TPR) repeat protein